MSEFAVRSRELRFVLGLDFPEPDFALAFAVMAAAKATQHSLLELALCHRNDVVLLRVHCRVIVTSLVYMISAEFSDSRETIEQVL